MRYLHTMVRVTDLDASIDFYCNKLGLVETNRKEFEAGRFTLVFLAAPGNLDSAKATRSPELELTYNWDPEEYDGGRNFGHLAYYVDDSAVISDPRGMYGQDLRVTLHLISAPVGPIRNLLACVEQHYL